MVVTTGEVLKRRNVMETRSEIKTFCVGFLCLLCFLVGASAHAELFIFGQITGDTAGICPDAFLMEVIEQGDQALFTFTNNCDSDGFLGRIFIMDNDLITFDSIYEQPEGVSFSPPDWKNAMLPGGEPLGFTPHNTYSIEADPARPKNGLHYQDYVSILFDLNDEVEFSDVTGSIEGGMLGVGIHAQSLPGGSSASFTTIPEPATVGLLGVGALLLIGHKKRGTAQ
jgi:hypothetical protein